MNSAQYCESWLGGLDYIHRKVATSLVTIATLCEFFFLQLRRGKSVETTDYI